MLKKILVSGFFLFLILSLSSIAQTIIKDDFRVNDDYDVGGSSQSYPAIAMDHNGNFVVVWLDQRNGGTDIYGQRFDRWGNPLGENFKVNDTSGESIGKRKYVGYYLGTAMDADGDFVVVWEDYRNNNPDIYAQRYDSTGSPMGNNFKVNDDLDFCTQISPSVAMNSSGEFVAVWIDCRESAPALYGQRYSSAGDKIEDNFKIDSYQQVEKVGVSQPSLAINPGGEFVVTWTAALSSALREIHAIRVNAKNEIIDTVLKVNESDTSMDVMSPAVAIDAPGNFVITWLEKSSNSLDILAQRFSFKGETSGTNFKVNNSSGRSFKKFPKVTMNLTKEFTIAWVELRDMLNIYIQHYNQHGEPVGGNFKITDFGQTWGPTNIDITGSPSGCLAIAWDRYECTSDNEIFVTLMNHKMEIVKETVKADYDYGSSSQKYPAIAASSSGHFAISWDDIRFCIKDIYSQRLNSSGEFLGSNFKVNQYSYGSSSSISMDSSGNSVIAFLGNLGIYFQEYDYNGGKLGENTFANDEPMFPFLSTPDVVMGLRGDFVVVWSQAMVSTSGVFAQLFDSQGNKVDSNFIVSDFLDTTQYSYTPKVAKCANGNFVVVWENFYKSSSKMAVWGQLYNPSGNRIGDNFMISDSTVSLSNYYPDVGMDKDGNFVVAWYGAGNILIQRFTADGSKIGAIIKAIDFNGMKISALALTVKSNGEFLVVWQDYRNGDQDIYAQRFDKEGNPLGGNFRVNSDEGDYSQTTPVVAADDKNYYFAWMDNRGPASGYDIFCKIISFEQTFVSEDESVNKPELPLLQNYPNPFNPATTIHFRVNGSQFVVHSPIHTTLVIYNILGQMVRILVDEEKSPGDYQVIWDGKSDEGEDVSSGIYFYVLKTEALTLTKKMTLIR